MQLQVWFGLVQLFDGVGLGMGIGLGKGQAIIYKLAKADCGCCGLYADDDIE